MQEIFRDVHLEGEDTTYDLWIEDGILKKKRPAAQRSTVGLWALPAGVDVQVHLRTPGQSEKETPETGLQAALAGGYGAVLSMPNTKPTMDRVEVLRRRRPPCKAPVSATELPRFFARV